MWTRIASLEPIVDELHPAFTTPSYTAGCDLLLAWVMCLGRHTLRRVGQTAHPEVPPNHTRRHGLDTFYNFFERSAWTPAGLAHRGASTGWVISQFAWRWAIEVLFRSRKQVLDIEAAQHRSQECVEKLAPWVWSMQSVIMVWYLTAGCASAEAEELRSRMGEWDSEWSLRHMLQVLRRAILNATITSDSANAEELREMVKTLKNWANLAA